MIYASDALHQAIQQRNPSERVLFWFGPTEDLMPTVERTVLAWTDADIPQRTGVKITESVNGDTELFCGKVMSSTIGTAIFNEHGYLTNYLEQVSFDSDCTAFLGAKIAEYTEDDYTGQANCIAYINYAGQRIPVTGHSRTPYLRIAGQAVTNPADTSGQYNFPIYALLVDENVAAGTAMIYAIGEQPGQFYSVLWRFGATWEGLSTMTWGEIAAYTWGDFAGKYEWATPQIARYMSMVKYPQLAKARKGLSINGWDIYDFAIDGSVSRWEYVSLGIFRFSRPRLQNESIIKFNAYDLMTKFDVDVAEWAQSISYPITLLQLYDQLCAFCGVRHTPATDILNASMVISTPLELPRGTTGRTLLGYIAEAAGANARMNRNGLIELAWFTAQNYAVRPDMLFTSEIANYTVANVSKMTIAVPQTEGETVIVAVGTGDNEYRLTNNPLLNRGTTSEVEQRITPIFNRISAFMAYEPIRADCICDWTIQAGDILQLYDSNGVMHTLPIFTQTITYRGVATVYYQNSGEPTRPTPLDAATANTTYAAQNAAKVRGANIRSLSAFATCDTASNDSAKTVSQTGFTQQEGALLTVRFTHGNTASAPLLSVNTGTAMPIVDCFNGAKITADAIQNGHYAVLLYTNTAWVLLNPYKSK